MDHEIDLAGLIRRGAHRDAATLALQVYGDEVFGFLVHHLGDESAAGEVFSQLTEDLWRGLPGFGVRCAVRTWLYLLARHAAARFRRSPWNVEHRREGESQLREVAASQRSRTPAWFRSDVKDRWSALREALSPDDRSLLALRIDRRMSWHQIAFVFVGGGAPSAEALKRESVRLRKRFQLLKEELRARAHASGLLALAG